MTPANWVSNNVPVPSTTYALQFAGSTRLTPNNDFAAFSNFGSITFNAGAGAFTLGGNSITINGNILNSSTNLQTISNSLRLGSTAPTWSVSNTTGSLLFNGVVDLNATDNTTHVLTIGGTGSVTFSNTIQNSFAGSSGNLSHNTASTLTLSGNNTYTGATQLTGGTTLINGNQTSATGQVSVNNSGTILGGIGTIGGTVQLLSGAKITGGTNGTVGTLTLKNGASLAGSASNIAGYLVDISGATSDKLAVTGTLSLSTAFDSISFSGTADGTTTYVLATYTTETGVFDTVTNLPSGYQLVYLPHEVDLVPVPEPSTWGAAAIAAAVIAYPVVQRRRRTVTG